MPVYVRKISRSKWEKHSVNGVIPNNDPDADAITGCTKTSENSLSLWLVDDDSKNQIKRAILALASVFPQGIETFHILIVEQEEIDSKFIIKNNIADTPYKAMNSNHYDIIELKHSSLKTVSDVIISGLNANKAIRVKKADAISYLKEAIANSSISISDLNDKIKREVE